MGDRRSIIVRFDEQHSVALYTHWAGSVAPQRLAAGLETARGRWGDPSYLTRILFCHLLGDSENLFNTTGYGIEPFTTGTASYCEASPGYDLVVDPVAQTVTGDDQGSGTVLTFDQFIAHLVPA